jgi:cyclohexanone monooxygenase
MDNFNILVSGGIQQEDLVNDGWTEIIRNLLVLVRDEKADLGYRQFCKRPCFHDDYLPTFNRPNVTLVDTKGRGVERVTERGVVANGKEYEVDCLIFATGFEVDTDYTRRAGYDLIGRDGLTLTEKWKDGMSTFHGMHTRGFPNVFILSPAQSGFMANFPPPSAGSRVAAGARSRRTRTPSRRASWTCTPISTRRSDGTRT